MTQLTPEFQQFIDLRNGTTIGVHIVTILTAADTLKVPRLAQRTSDDIASKQLVREGDDTGITLTDNANEIGHLAAEHTVTLTGGTPASGNTKAGKALIVTVHDNSALNSSVLGWTSD